MDIINTVRSISLSSAAACRTCPFEVHRSLCMDLCCVQGIGGFFVSVYYSSTAKLIHVFKLSEIYEMNYISEIY